MTTEEIKKDLLSRLKDFQEEMEHDCTNWNTVKYQIDEIIETVEKLP